MLFQKEWTRLISISIHLGVRMHYWQNAKMCQNVNLVSTDTESATVKSDNYKNLKCPFLCITELRRVDNFFSQSKIKVILKCLKIHKIALQKFDQAVNFFVGNTSEPQQLQAGHTSHSWGAQVETKDKAAAAANNE